MFCYNDCTPFQILNLDLNKILKWFNALNRSWVKIGSRKYIFSYKLYKNSCLGFEFNWRHLHQNYFYKSATYVSDFFIFHIFIPRTVDIDNFRLCVPRLILQFLACFYLNEAIWYSTWSTFVSCAQADLLQTLDLPHP